MRKHCLPALLFLILVATGCDADNETPTPPFEATGPQPPLPMLEHGHFRGLALIGGEPYSVEALITIDGTVRLHVAGPTDSTGVLSGAGLGRDELDPPESALFVGDIDLETDARTGYGVIIGETCSGPTPGRFCGAPVDAEISITHVIGSPLTVEVRTTAVEPQEIWLAEIGKWSADYASAADRAPAGQFIEELAQFASLRDVVINVDSAGLLFFQSSESGCTGNGDLAAHPPGDFYVFDVTLTIASCDARYAFLNGDFDGLATVTQNGYWDYDSWLLMFLAKVAGSPSGAAITMIGSPL